MYIIKYGISSGGDIVNLLAILQLERLRKMNKYDLRDIKKISAVASELRLKALLTQIYTDSSEYLKYIEKKGW